MISLGKYSQPLPVVGMVNRKGFFPTPSSTTCSGNIRTLALPQWQSQMTSPTSLTLNLINYKANSVSSTPLHSLDPNATASANVSVITTKEEEGLNENPVKFDAAYVKRAGLRHDRMPKHVAVTLDGSRRWSQKNNGGECTYEPFYDRYLQFGDLCIKLGIPVATWFIFATCTWKRSEEANHLMFRQMQASLEDNLEKFMRKGIKVSIIGEKWRLPVYFKDAIKRVEEATKNGKTLHAMYAIPYGGRWDIVEATQSISRKVMAGEIELEDIDEALVAEQLPTRASNVPDPDFMIRSGGKRRLSNFYLWQSAHAELYFSDSLCSDFGEVEFLEALRWFQQCERRFGK